MSINEDLLKHRMLRGALFGAAEPEKAPMRYCKGKLDNGRPCRVVMLGDEEYCRRHKQEIEALEAGAPLRPGRDERSFGEKIAMAKKGICKVCGKKDTQIIGAGMCYMCRKAALEAGTYPEPASIVPQKKLSDVPTVAQEVVRDEVKESLEEMNAHVDAGWEPAELEIMPATPNEHAEAGCLSSSPLTRLLAAAVPPPPPLPPYSLVVTLDAYRYSKLVESEVSAEEVARLIGYLLDGELQRVSRAAA